MVLRRDFRVAHGAALLIAAPDGSKVSLGPGPWYGCWGENVDAAAREYGLRFKYGGRVEGGAFSQYLPYKLVAGAKILDVRSEVGATHRLHVSGGAGTYFTGWVEPLTRALSLRAVEAFYDALMPELGLSVKKYSHVDSSGDWHNVDEHRCANVVEYFEAPDGPSQPRFIGFIEDATMEPTATRIAFRIDGNDFERMKRFVASIGALRIEESTDPEYDTYSALFFEDPGGTKLEFAAR